MKILILVNTLQNISSFIYANHVHFFVKTIKTDPSIELLFFTPHRMSIDSARNNAAKLAMQYKCDYLMFIDDDVMIPDNSLELLIKADKDIVAGLVIIRGMPFNVMAFKYESPTDLVYYNDLPLLEPCKQGHINFNISCDDCHLTSLESLVKVDAVGFSCCLIKTDVLYALEPPYFVTGTNHTEDIYFCLKTEELDPKPTMYLHTGIQCGHLLNPEPIEWASRRRMQKIYKETQEKQDELIRDENHLDNCIARLM